MARLVSRGRFTREYVKALLAAPEDREAPVRKLIEGAGGKVLSFYFTTGDRDFLLIAEANDPESLIAAMLAPVASGTITDVSTVRAWTGAEFKAVAEKAAKIGSMYRAPGKS
jgi:uncharacterized protein with GYD domain